MGSVEVMYCQIWFKRVRGSSFGLVGRLIVILAVSAVGLYNEQVVVVVEGRLDCLLCSVSLRYCDAILVLSFESLHVYRGQSIFDPQCHEQFTMNLWP